MKAKLNQKNFSLNQVLSYFVILVFLLLGLLKTDSFGEKIFTFFVFFSLFVFLIFLKEKKFWKKQVSLYLLLLVSYFLLTAFFRGQDIRKKISQEPVRERYFSDEILFLKTYFLMKKGIGYYPAFAQAVVDHGMMSRVSSEVWAWRWPTVFYFWQYLTPNSFWLQILFLGTACLVLISAFSIAQNFLDKPLALLPPFLLIPYFLESAANTYFLFTEWWGVMFFLVGMAFFLKQKKTGTIILFSLAILTREFLLIPLLAFLIISLIFKKDSRLLILPLVIFFFGIILHYLKIFQFLSFFPQLSPSSRLHQPNFLLLQKEFAFNSREYLLVDYRVLIWFFFFSLIGLILALIYKNNLREKPLYALASFLPMVFLNIFSGTIYHEFWALLFMPLVIIFSPVVLIVFLPMLKFNETRKIQS